MNKIENTWRLVPTDAAQNELAEVRVALGFLPQGYAAMAGLDRLADLLVASDCLANTASNRDECDPQVYEWGASVGLFAIPKDDANAICEGIAAATGARVDWHYIAGRVHIKALPAPAPAAGDARDVVDVDWQLMRETATLVRDRFSAALSIAYASSDATRRAIRRTHETYEALLAMLDAAIAAQRKGDA